MLKTILIILLVLGFFTTISAFIPDSIATSIDNAFIYFLNFLWYLEPIVNVQTIFNCLGILINFFAGLAVFRIIWGVLELVS